MTKAAVAGQASTEAGTTTPTAEETAAAAKAAADAAAGTTQTPEEKAAAEAQAATDKAAADAKAKTDADAAAAKVEADKKAAEKAGGAAGDLTLTVPEGAEDLVSKEQLDYFTAVAKASGWTAEDAQAELAAHVDREKGRIAAQSAKWAEETKADTEIGGEALSTTQRNVKAALDRFLPETEPDGKALRTALNAGGYGNWRPLVKFLARIGKAMGEDSPIVGQGAGGSQDTADVLYDHPTSKATTT